MHWPPGMVIFQGCGSSCHRAVGSHWDPGHPGTRDIPGGPGDGLGMSLVVFQMVHPLFQFLKWTFCCSWSFSLTKNSYILVETTLGSGSETQLVPGLSLGKPAIGIHCSLFGYDMGFVLTADSKLS